MRPISNSELILNKDGSVYHLGLLPGEIAETVITVGDPDRVDMVLKHFDELEFTRQNREFKSATGSIFNKRVSVVSTGIGTDNVDIVFNEIDALFNINLATRTPIINRKVIQFIRLGTSGLIDSEIPLDTIRYSRFALSADALLKFYKHPFEIIKYQDFHFPVIQADSHLQKAFSIFEPCFTLTAPGFYGPQGRSIALQSKLDLKNVQASITHQGMKLANLEMETAGIYGLGSLLGHQCISINAFLANRITGEFSSSPEKTIQRMIEESLSVLKSL